MASGVLTGRPYWVPTSVSSPLLKRAKLSVTLLSPANTGSLRFFERAPRRSPRPLRSRPHQARFGALARAAGRELFARVETRRCCAGLGKTQDCDVQLRDPSVVSRNLAGNSEGAAPPGTALPPPLSLSIRCTQVFVEGNLGPPQPIWNAAPLAAPKSQGAPAWLEPEWRHRGPCSDFLN